MSALSLIQAVNGPLQERMNVLDLDFSRANQLPDDYDTDLESAWSNLSEKSFSAIVVHFSRFI